MTAILVVTYQSRAVIDRCLEPLRGRRVLVVDNASPDGTADHVVTAFPWVSVAHRTSNGGFARAVDEGLVALPDELVLLLNPDVIAEPAAIEMLERYMREHPRVALAGPTLTYEDGTLQPSVRAFPSPLTIALRRSPLGRLPGLRSALRRRLYAHGAAAGPVDWLLGAAMIVRRDAVVAVGGMDAAFFLYAEDVDLCHRLWQAGHEVHHVPDAAMVHLYHRESARAFDLRRAATRHHWASLVRLYRKHPGLLAGRSPRPIAPVGSRART